MTNGDMAWYSHRVRHSRQHEIMPGNADCLAQAPSAGVAGKLFASSIKAAQEEKASS